MSTQVKTPQIATDSVVVTKVKDGELTVAKFSATAIAAGSDVSTGTSTTKIVTPNALANADTWTLRQGSIANRREELHANRFASVTTATKYLNINMSGSAGYGAAYVDVTIGGIGSGLATGASHARYWVTLDNTTVVITQIGSTETIGSSAAPALTTSVSGYNAQFFVAKGSGTTSTDVNIFTTVQCLDGSNITYTITYS